MVMENTAKKKGVKRWSRNKFGRHIKLDPLNIVKLNELSNKLSDYDQTLKIFLLCFGVSCASISRLSLQACATTLSFKDKN